MSATIYRHELRRLLRSVWKWSLGVLLVHYVYLPFFPAFAQQQSAMEAFLRQLPSEYLAALGFKAGVSYASVLGFYTMVFRFVQLVLAVQASRYGVDLLSSEERYGTADFLLTRPVSRAQVFWAKFAAALSALALTWAVVWVTAWSSIALFHGDSPYDGDTLALILSSVLPFQVFFLAVGAALSMLVRKVRNSTPWALGLAFALYALSAFADVQGNAITDALAWLSPFTHFQPAVLMAQRAYDLPALGFSLGVTWMGLILAWLLFRRRDIPAAL